MYRQSEKNLLSSNISPTCPHNMVNFGPLAAEIFSLVWCTPGNFNGFRVLPALLHGTIVVGVSQTAALNRGRHRYSAGRPSRWALAHILVLYHILSLFNIVSCIWNALAGIFPKRGSSIEELLFLVFQLLFQPGICRAETFQHSSKLSLWMGDLDPIWHMIPWTHPSPQPKRHLDRFSCFCRAQDYDRLTDSQTT